MKRIALASLAALVFAAPLAATSASAQSYHNGDRDGGDRRGSWNDDRSDRDDDNGRDSNGRGGNYRDGDRRGDWDDNRRRRGNSNRWDRSQYNGYSYNGRWNYGPPPGAYENDRGYQLGYREWRRGDRLPYYYRSSYRRVDYRREHLRPPPRGYDYVQGDRGEYLLVGVLTGVILGVILNENNGY